jgi:hypothetical protein
MPRSFQSWAGLLVPVGVFLMLAPVAGCSSYGTVSGKVTYQGEPLTGGTILFTSSRGKGTRSSPIGEDGSYTIANMPSGDVKIAVETKSAQPPPSGAKGPPMSMQPPPGVALPPGTLDSPIYNPALRKGFAVKIPERYADPEQSGIPYVVTSGPQTYNIDLK